MAETHTRTWVWASLCVKRGSSPSIFAFRRNAINLRWCSAYSLPACGCHDTHAAQDLQRSIHSSNAGCHTAL
eukprot:6936949-Alexandrium_andersonii.AAC.1